MATNIKKIRKKKIIDFKRKDKDDRDRISEHLEQRNALALSLPKKDKENQLPETAKISPLKRLIKKIKELYEEEDDEDDDNEIYTPFFDVDLMDEKEKEEKKEEKRTKKTIKLMREHEYAQKFNIISDALNAAREAGFSGKLTMDDERLLNTAQFNPYRIRRRVIKEKIVRPIEKLYDTPENVSEALSNLHAAQMLINPEGLREISPREKINLEKRNKDHNLAQLILKKVGRKKKKAAKLKQKKDNQTNYSPTTDASLDKTKEKS